MTKEEKAKLIKEFGLCMTVSCDYKPARFTHFEAKKTSINLKKAAKVREECKMYGKLKLASVYGEMVKRGK